MNTVNPMIQRFVKDKDIQNDQNTTKVGMCVRVYAYLCAYVYHAQLLWEKSAINKKKKNKEKHNKYM